ncbi:SRPBCC family protein [Nesterenkonia flava]
MGYAVTLPVPAEKVWALVSNPHRHHELDGSGTVRDRAVGPHVLSEGARFSVHMRKFGLPYRLPLKVTRARAPEAGTGTGGVVEWRQPTGHRWRWEMQPINDGEATVVTETYDATGQNPLARAVLSAVKVPAENARNIRASLERLQQLMAPQ